MYEYKCNTSEKNSPCEFQIPVKISFSVFFSVCFLVSRSLVLFITHRPLTISLHENCIELCSILRLCRTQDVFFSLSNILLCVCACALFSLFFLSFSNNLILPMTILTDLSNQQHVCSLSLCRCSNRNS